MNGKINIVGMGPGKYEKMTIEAVNAIKESSFVIGYTLYVDLLKEYFPEKNYDSTPMKKEIERCHMCFKKALLGETVSLICSGDAGVYGMASPMLQLKAENSEYSKIDISVIPGVTAACSGSAVLGAPLNHDFCTISLSDLLTPWETIEKRLRAAVAGDFVIALYNPSSHKRKDYLKKACKIILDAGADLERSCGYVENIGRDGTRAAVCTLAELENREVNMFTTVFIGNSQSQLLFTDSDKPVLLTKRGYEI